MSDYCQRASQSHSQWWSWEIYEVEQLGGLSDLKEYLNPLCFVVVVVEVIQFEVQAIK